MKIFNFLTFLLLIFFCIFNFVDCKKENKNIVIDSLFYTEEEIKIIFSGDTSIPFQAIPSSSTSLKKLCKEVKVPNDTTSFLVKRLIKTLKVNNKYKSISAPEFGINRKIIILRNNKNIEVLINPKLITHSNLSTNYNEFCITQEAYLPNTINRYRVIFLSYYDLNGNKQNKLYEDTLAFEIQHHLEHFNGKVITDIYNPYEFTPEEVDIIMSGNDTTPMRIYLITNKEDSIVLRKKSTDVYPDSTNPLLMRLIKRLEITVKKSGGVGIAAPQVGINKNIIFVKRLDKQGSPFEVYLNPVINATTHNTITFNGDGCLSIPGVYGKTVRWPSISVSYYLLNGKKYSEVVYGYSYTQFTAIIFQHEIDHLNGILFIDRLVTN